MELEFIPLDVLEPFLMRVIFTLVQRLPPSKDALDKGLSTYFLMLPLVSYIEQ